MIRFSAMVAISLIAVALLAIIVGAWLARRPTRQPVSRHITCKSVALLAADFTNPAPGEMTALVVRDNPNTDNMSVFEPGDYVMLRTFTRSGRSLTIEETFGVVASYVDLNDGFQMWTFARGSGATAGEMRAGMVVVIGSLVIDYGFPGGTGCNGSFFSSG